MIEVKDNHLSQERHVCAWCILLLGPLRMGLSGVPLSYMCYMLNRTGTTPIVACTD
jgi:hypothetical protein